MKRPEKTQCTCSAEIELQKDLEIGSHTHPAAFAMILPRPFATTDPGVGTASLCRTATRLTGWQDTRWSRRELILQYVLRTATDCNTQYCGILSRGRWESMVDRHCVLTVTLRLTFPFVVSPFSALEFRLEDTIVCPASTTAIRTDSSSRLRPSMHPCLDMHTQPVLAVSLPYDLLMYIHRF